MNTFALVCESFALEYVHVYKKRNVFLIYIPYIQIKPRESTKNFADFQ